MTLKRWDGAAYQDIAAIKRWDGASWVDLTVLKRWDGAAWIDIALPGGGGGGLSATINTSSISGMVFASEPAPLFSPVATLPVTVTATGGMGAGPTYLWQRISGSSAVSADFPTAASTSFSGTVGKNQEASAVFRCTVTRGVESVQVIVNVLLIYTTNL
jgi:hypothetical protein